MTPFILMGRKRLPPESAPSDEQVYDDYRQLWINKKSGTPVVTAIQVKSQVSNFGETTISKTQEGVDQLEGTDLSASSFGETTLTETREGVDQLEVATFVASTLTRTVEGADLSEIATLPASPFGETTHTATREGVDQSEVAAFPDPHAPHSHFR